MKFGEEPVARAAGAILAHSMRASGAIYRKGHLLTPEDVVRLGEAGVSTVMVARLDVDDVPEDAAAARIAAALVGANVATAPPATGRVNLMAVASGLVEVDRSAVDALNLVTEDVTLATLSALTPVYVGERVATIKIIPFSVPETRVRASLVAAAQATISIRPFRPSTARLIQTTHDGFKDSVLDKTVAVTAERLTKIDCTLVGETRCRHERAALAETMRAAMTLGCDLLMVIGASAIADRRDVIPAAIEQLEGHIERLGMPVEPGNLILVGEIGSTPVLGLPGCARSPVRNGLDWVLERISVGLPVTHEGIGHMGVGGLLIGRDDDKDYL